MSFLDVFADVSCPFAHAGLQAAVSRRHELGRDDLRMRIRAWPLELVNGKPLDPMVIHREIMDLRDQIGAHLFRGFDPSTFPSSSLPAFSLAAAAYRRSEESGEKVSLALRNALFEEGLDISDPEVLGHICETYGLDPITEADEAQVQEDWLAGQRLGVKGSPHFFCRDVEAFCPSLDISKGEDGHLRIRPDPVALDAFLTQCLSGSFWPRH